MTLHVSGNWERIIKHSRGSVVIMQMAFPRQPWARFQPILIASRITPTNGSEAEQKCPAFQNSPGELTEEAQPTPESDHHTEAQLASMVMPWFPREGSSLVRVEVLRPSPAFSQQRRQNKMAFFPLGTSATPS